MSEKSISKVGSPLEVKEQIKELLQTKRIRIVVQEYPETHVITDDLQVVQIINPTHFITYQGIPVLRINHGWHDLERVFVKEDKCTSLVIHQHQTIESALWYMVILTMEILDSEAPREDVAKIAETLTKDPDYIEEMMYLLADNAEIDGNLSDTLPLSRLILSSQQIA